MSTPFMAFTGFATILAWIGCLCPTAAADDGVFEPYPAKADMLIVVAHPDDESTFGGLIPYYAVCRNKKVVFVCLTSGEWGNGLPHHSSVSETPDYSYNDADVPRFEKIPADALYPCYYREQELARALMIMGVKTKPVMPRFKDMSGVQPWGSPDPAFDLWGGRDKVVGFVASQIQRFKPELVVSMAANGFNGNPLHAAASRAAVLASKPSATAAADAWQPRKVYLQVAEDEQYDRVHQHSWDLDCRGSAGKARVLAARGNVQHESQGMKEQCEASTDFVLVRSSVGPDTIGADNLFENINPD
jgi:LmbE family N-acetylglucosaminyl deacetylase